MTKGMQRTLRVRSIEVKCIVLWIAKRIVAASIVFAAGLLHGHQSGKYAALRAINSLCMTQGSCRTAFADAQPTKYGRIVYALDGVHSEEVADVPSITNIGHYFLTATNAAASGGWRPVKNTEAEQ